MYVEDIINQLEKIAPTDLAEEWDNVGLLIGDRKNEVSGILISLDCDESTVDFAIKNNLNLIITHHPIIFKGLKKITELNKNVVKLIQNNISVYSAHTNFDNCSRSMNNYIADKVGAFNIIKEQEGIIFSIKTTLLKDFALKVKEIISEDMLKIKGDLRKNVSTVYLCTGSGMNPESFALAEDVCDVFVTSEIKHNYWVEASKLALIEFSHFSSELPFESIVYDILKSAEIPVKKANSNKPYKII